MLWSRAAEIFRELPDAIVGVGPKPLTAKEAAIAARPQRNAGSPGMIPPAVGKSRRMKSQSCFQTVVNLEHGIYGQLAELGADFALDWRGVVRILERPLRKRQHLARSPLAVIVKESFDSFVDILAQHNTLRAVQDKWHGFPVPQSGRLIERQLHGSFLSNSRISVRIGPIECMVANWATFSKVCMPIIS